MNGSSRIVYFNIHIFLDISFNSYLFHQALLTTFDSMFKNELNNVNPCFISIDDASIYWFKPTMQ